MRLMKLAGVVLAAGLVSALAQPVSAQPVPDTGMSAVSGSVGVLLPEDPLDPGLILQGSYQYFFSPRVGLRTTLGWAAPDFKRSDDSLRQIPVIFDLIYNWEGGTWHPYVGAGLGPYFVQHRSDGSSRGPSGTKLATSLLGGVEYFTDRYVSLLLEANYRFVSDDDLPWSASNLVLSFGIKRYL